MKILKITTGPLAVNTYFLINEISNKAVMIDGGHLHKQIKDFADKNGFTITAELLTHSHFDHSLSAKLFQKDGVKIYASLLESEKLKNNQTLAKDFGLKAEPLIVDEVLSDGQEIVLEDIVIKVINTPGHTDGSIIFVVEDKIFSGDTLFLESYGRTDFPSGNFGDMVTSINKILSMQGEYVVYPGHGEQTTLSHERKFNPLSRQ